MGCENVKGIIQKLVVSQLGHQLSKKLFQIQLEMQRSQASWVAARKKRRRLRRATWQNEQDAGCNRQAEHLWKM